MFFRKSQKKPTQTAEERWMDNRHTFYLKSRVECVHIRGRDIECCWVDGRGKITYNNPYFNDCDFMIRTKSGKEFSLRFEDWLKVVHEDENYQ